MSWREGQGAHCGALSSLRLPVTSPPQSLQHKGKVHAGALVLANREWGMDRPATTTYPQHRREPMNHLPLTHTVHGDADHVRSLFAQEDKRNAS
ncbi:hypothetical protein ZX61_09900 [Vibrio sp. VPAP30]|nr:hypothetical protein ZX61_09900 [Vibrio sp. VPAP30]